MAHAKHPIRPPTLAIALIALAAASLGACTPKAQEELRDVGKSTTEAARENAATLGQKIDQGIDKARIAGATVARAAGEALDDTAITAETKAALAKDDEIRSGRVEVSTKEGKVELRGKVPTDSARARAASIARSAKGATSVDNQLVVGPAASENK